MVYINIYVLVPRFFFKTKYVTYLALLCSDGGCRTQFYRVWLLKCSFEEFRVKNILRENEKEESMKGSYVHTHYYDNNYNQASAEMDQ